MPFPNPVVDLPSSHVIPITCFVLSLGLWVSTALILRKVRALNKNTQTLIASARAILAEARRSSSSSKEPS